MTTRQAHPLPIRVMLVDDHEVVRVGLRTLFGQTKHIEVVGEAGTVAEAVLEAGRVAPHVVVMDLRLPDGTGLDACREILSADPTVRVLFLTSYSDEEAVMSTILAGAAGYVLKEIRQESLIHAIETVASGQSILDPKVTQTVLGQVATLAGQLRTTKAGSKDDLSPQEGRILELVVEGKTNKEIAATLGLSAKTVKNYLSNAFQKLHVSRRSHAAVLFSRQSNKLERD